MAASSGGIDRRPPHGAAVDGPVIFHFFKFILSDTLEEKKLRIPCKFIRRFKHELTDVAHLSVPNGRVWRVGLSKKGNAIWFDHNWKNFAEHHSICLGYFLVFGYRGFGSFNVIIFDPTASEVEFPLDIEVPGCGEIGNEVKMEYDSPSENRMEPSREAADVASRDFEDIDIGGHKTKREKRRKRRISEEFAEPLVIDSSEAESLDENGDKDIEMITCENFEGTPESERAIADARMYKPKNPSFMVLLRASSFQMNRLYIPSRFSRHLVGAPSRMVLRVSDGREWEVWLYVRGCNRWDIGSGWNLFRDDNNLIEGDVCVFELLKNKEVMKVSIFRASEDSS